MAVQHPNIAPVIGFFLSEGLGIISPWYANGNVATYISRHPEVDRVKLVSMNKIFLSVNPSLILSNLNLPFPAVPGSKGVRCRPRSRLPTWSISSRSTWGLETRK